MKLIFNKKPIFRSRIIITIIISIIIIITDIYSDYLIELRYSITNRISPIYFFLNKPFFLYKKTLNYFKENNLLQKKNKYLYNKILKQNIKLYSLQKIKYDNINLRNILQLSILKKKKNILAEIIPVYFPRHKDIIFINKGLKDNITPGTVVLNDKGVVGQIITSTNKSSQVSLICNKKIFLPVQIKNSDIKFIISGNGCTKNLQSEYISTDIILNKGDILVTSGLDELYPIGYPVGVITEIFFDKRKNFNIAYVKPFFQIEKIKYLILLINSK
ncbi:rod shape-determining protein MreC [Enterobacteriaceae endosymbiont of Donacia bicoloricornis]|uniref:rod shape-determining protein MreC n=1 Tax=Enterobacteriaceae endosymbiont of Donacia bicoloricornis TaxID=2675772 RepID=UPI00144A0873|nr:rod shape-determining protein MreC [Enterobacteriaceae endosymbiont of Donacia bicoloricornis]QJC37557.1 rod shape-determining protein MreC [Enterobacteriaceae endosymbiont of Donacia bicoloricornis]